MSLPIKLGFLGCALGFVSGAMDGNWFACAWTVVCAGWIGNAAFMEKLYAKKNPAI